MAYTLHNIGIIRPWDHSEHRYIHRQIRLTADGSGDAVGSCSIPCPGRLVAMTYAAPNATDSLGVGAALTSGAVTLKAETTAGVQIWTDADLSSVPTRPLPVGTTSYDETGAATAATDGYSGGFPVRNGVYATLASGTENEVLVLDLWFRLCTWVKIDAYPVGADGSAVWQNTLRLGNAGVVSAIAVDYINLPNTTDVVINADSSNGPALFTKDNNNTDIAPSLLGAPGADEAINATAVTDGTENGNAFKQGLYINIHDSDGQTSGNEHAVIELWIDD